MTRCAACPHPSPLAPPSLRDVCPRTGRRARARPGAQTTGVSIRHIRVPFLPRGRPPRLSARGTACAFPSRRLPRAGCPVVLVRRVRAAPHRPDAPPSCGPPKRTLATRHSLAPHVVLPRTSCLHTCTTVATCACPSSAAPSSTSRQRGLSMFAFTIRILHRLSCRLATSNFSLFSAAPPS